jgi:hypothetical protein
MKSLKKIMIVKIDGKEVVKTPFRIGDRMSLKYIFDFLSLRAEDFKILPKFDLNSIKSLQINITDIDFKGSEIDVFI